MSGLQVQLHSSSPIRLQAEFDCGAGELVALVGPSGSGKTSMLRAIAGLWTPADVQGQIRVDGQSWLDTAAGVHLSPQQRRAGLVFQHYALFPHMTAHANVALAAGPGWSAADVQALLKRMGLDALTQRRPAQLSGGQQQRVALARALVRVMPTPSSATAASPTPPALPGVLLLDEPFSAVDAPTRQTLYRELAALRQQVSVPMVLVTHDLAEARRLADRVVIVDAGQTLQTGQPSRVFASPRNARVAELVGIQNHFAGCFYKDQPGWARLRWTQAGDAHAAIDLTVVDKNKIDDGTPVTWVLNGEQVDVLADASAPDQADAGATRLRCRLVEVLALGEISLCTLTPEALPAETITLNLTTRLLERLQVNAGGWVQLLIAPGALHIMPVRETSA
ncbi:ABC transporter ATP-binding protein [Limnohabitans sp. T6-20]|uniref:ABC transporter ATP-binding protein n=1 Tax=Limnohabitans sp. T6-20 TaxID=1100725 RepID=UPI000D38E59D|nr:ABC transporter ATP-binding protein [Limnohabitans sp. T6-20]PUE12610.1 ABC transporter [Limnohabitans sp. T6-20]